MGNIHTEARRVFDLARPLASCIPFTSGCSAGHEHRTNAPCLRRWTCLRLSFRWIGRQMVGPTKGQGLGVACTSWSLRLKRGCLYVLWMLSPTIFPVCANHRSIVRAHGLCYLFSTHRCNQKFWNANCCDTILEGNCVNPRLCQPEIVDTPTKHRFTPCLNPCLDVRVLIYLDLDVKYWWHPPITLLRNRIQR